RPEGRAPVAGEADPGRASEGGGVPLDLLAPEVEDLRGLDRRLRAAASPGRVPDVRVPGSDPERSLGAFTTDPDRRMRLLERLGGVEGVSELVVPARVVGDVFGPQQLEDVQRLLQLSEASPRRELHAQHLEL